MKISISSPYPVDSLQGNSVSGRRISALLKESDYPVAFCRDDFSADTDVFIALNAWRSSSIIRDFNVHRECSPHNSKYLIVVMTGSDLFPTDGFMKQETLESIDAADAIVVTHDQGTEKIHHPVVREIRKSVVLPESILISKKHEAAAPFSGMIVAHLREQKNPFLFPSAIPYLKTPVKVAHYGSAESNELRQRAEKSRGTAYQWMGEVPRIDLLHALQRADFLLNTSHSEGSSNAICEAIALRTPVIASAIPGNIGVLGSEYPGLFRPDDAESLAAILDKFSDSGEFRNELKQHCDRLKTVFSVEQEKKAWSALIKQISSEKLSSYPVGSLR